MELYPQFLDCGYSPLLFEDLSIPEIIDLIESYQRRQKQKQDIYISRMKDLINILDGFSHNLVNNLGTMIAGGEYVNLKDSFPKLFMNEDSNGEKKKQLSPEMQVYKAQRIDHAYRVNKQREKEG